jgi:hypothetical protein
LPPASKIETRVILPRGIGQHPAIYAGGWSEAEVAWFEALLEEDNDIMAWAVATQVS